MGTESPEWQRLVYAWAGVMLVAGILLALGTFDVLTLYYTEAALAPASRLEPPLGYEYGVSPWNPLDANRSLDANR